MCCIFQSCILWMLLYFGRRYIEKPECHLREALLSHKMDVFAYPKIRQYGPQKCQLQS